MATFDEQAATELQLYIENDGRLYRQQGEPILRNLDKKKKKGAYNGALAEKLYMYYVDNGAKKYAKEFGGTWNTMFSVPTRKEVARRFARSFEAEHAAQGGNMFDDIKVKHPNIAKAIKPTKRKR